MLNGGRGSDRARVLWACRVVRLDCEIAGFEHIGKVWKDERHDLHACAMKGSSSICVVELKHSSPELFRAGAAVHCSFQGLQSVDLAFGLTMFLPHFDRTSGRFSVSV